MDGEDAYKFIPHWIRTELSESIITFSAFLQNIGWAKQFFKKNCHNKLYYSIYHHRTNDDFLEDFIVALKNGTDFDEYNFECPPTNRKTYRDDAYPFEFILLKSKGMLTVKSIRFKKSQMNYYSNMKFRPQEWWCTNKTCRVQKYNWSFERKDTRTRERFHFSFSLP